MENEEKRGGKDEEARKNKFLQHTQVKSRNVACHKGLGTETSPENQIQGPV